MKKYLLVVIPLLALSISCNVKLPPDQKTNSVCPDSTPIRCESLKICCKQNEICGKTQCVPLDFHECVGYCEKKNESTNTCAKDDPAIKLCIKDLECCYAEYLTQNGTKQRAFCVEVGVKSCQYIMDEKTQKLKMCYCSPGTTYNDIDILCYPNDAERCKNYPGNFCPKGYNCQSGNYNYEKQCAYTTNSSIKIPFKQGFQPNCL